jgi:transcriptional regulator with XRE-family HTH domain
MIWSSRKIKACRLSKGLTQAEVARLSRLTIDTISRIENNRAPNPDSDTIEALARAMRLKPAAFLK